MCPIDIEIVIKRYQLGLTHTNNPIDHTRGVKEH